MTKEIELQLQNETCVVYCIAFMLDCSRSCRDGEQSLLTLDVSETSKISDSDAEATIAESKRFLHIRDIVLSLSTVTGW